MVRRRGGSELELVEEPACRLLERLGWTHVLGDVLAAERGGEREVLLKRRLTRALLRLNDWLTEEQAERVVFDSEHLDSVGMSRNRAVHEHLTCGMTADADASDGRPSRTVRFFDFNSPEGGLNEFVVARQFRVRRGAGSGGGDGDRVVVADLVLFVNGIPLVVMDAKAPTLMWRQDAVEQIRRYQ